MTEGGDGTEFEQAGARTGWPTPPPGRWGEDPVASETGSAPAPKRRRSTPWAGYAVVAVLVAAILGVTAVAVGGEPREDDTASAERQFMPVGEAIDDPALDDPSMTYEDPSGTFEPVEPIEPEPEVVPIDDELGAFLPEDADVLDLPVLDASPIALADDSVNGPGEIGSFCLEDSRDTGGSHGRIWTSPGDWWEISVRILDHGSVETAREAVTLRQTDEFAECVPTMVQPNLIMRGLGNDVPTDESSVTTGDQLQRTILVGDPYEGGCAGVFAWRQVEQYIVSAKVFSCDPEFPLAIDSADPLLDASTDRITG